MTLSRNAKRRLALYGGGAAVGLAVLALPPLVRRATPPVAFRKFDVAALAKTEEVETLAAYLRIDTTNPPGDTRGAVAFLAERLACEGIPYEIVGDDPSMPILVARLAGTSREGALLLLNHMDVMPPGDLAAWKKPPFSGELGSGNDGAYLHGRGALDMKSYAIAQLFAMAALERAGLVPLRDVVFLAEPAEETYQPEKGVGWVLEHRPDLLAGVTDVFNEGGVNEVLTDRVDRFGVEVLQKGVIRLLFEGGDAKALEEFRAFLEKKDEEMPWRVEPTMSEFLQFIGPSRGDIWGRVLFDPENAMTSENFHRWAPGVYRLYLKDNIVCGAVEKGPSGLARLDVAWLVMPGDSVENAFLRIKGWAASRRLRFTVTFKTADSTATPREGSAWEAVRTVLELDPEKAPVGVYVIPSSYTNSSFLRARGFRAFGVCPFSININEAGRIHGPNERIHVGYFVEGVERMRAILREFATRA